ncbi:hypothetical protein [Nocardiopsis sp. NRRL B-16309]|uniref:hypothetical protein n=1 Tax=Nocardiopsis sp. NRRL B-16309 TaxID=1519494 RepID=UPI0006AF4634|nr:hypothetical protein [Nocardiopsis sp. NRRL B-16309]KOX17324.1 hypothetical protein ADL05_09495 [Nocardiopsis sp. NRRL B-16309]
MKASAYDDAFFRVATKVQMIGVLVITLGLPQLFHSIDEGRHLDNGLHVAAQAIGGEAHLGPTGRC